MKRQLYSLSRLLPLLLMVYVSCKKNEPDTPYRFTYPPPKPAIQQIHYSNKTIRGTILEYGSDKPLAGAVLTLQSFNEDNTLGFSLLNLESDSLGSLNFDAHEFQPINISRQGYWDNQWIQYPGITAQFFPGNTIFEDEGNSCDSFVFRLVPMADITVHLHDSSKSIDYDKLATENVSVYFNFSGIQPYTTQSGLGAIYLYKGIDSN